MPAAGTLLSVCSGHGNFPARQAAQAEAALTINGKPVLVDGNLFKDHSDGDSKHNGTAETSRPWFTINGKGIVCVDDKVSCGSVVATGEASFEVK